MFEKLAFCNVEISILIHFVAFEIFYAVKLLKVHLLC